MRIVKKALRAAGYRLKYSRKADSPGYYIHQQPAISDELAEILAHSVAEVDPAQIRIWRQMPSRQQSHAVDHRPPPAVAYRQQNPELNLSSPLAKVSG